MTGVRAHSLTKRAELFSFRLHGHIKRFLLQTATLPMPRLIAFSRTIVICSRFVSHELLHRGYLSNGGVDRMPTPLNKERDMRRLSLSMRFHLMILHPQFYYPRSSRGLKGARFTKGKIDGNINRKPTANQVGLLRSLWHAWIGLPSRNWMGVS